MKSQILNIRFRSVFTRHALCVICVHLLALYSLIGDAGWFLSSSYAITVTNGPATNIQATAAVFCGNVTATNGTTNAFSLRLCYGSSDGTTNFTWWGYTNPSFTVASTGAFSTNVTGLTGSSRYYYRWYAIQGTNTCWSTTSNFWTIAGAPTGTAPTSAYHAVMVDTNGDLAAPTNFFNNIMPLNGNRAMSNNLNVGGFYIYNVPQIIENLSTYPASGELNFGTTALGGGWLCDRSGDNIFNWATNLTSERAAFSVGGGGATFSWSAPGINMRNHTITNLADGSSAKDAATFGQLNDASNALHTVDTNLQSQIDDATNNHAQATNTLHIVDTNLQAQIDLLLPLDGSKTMTGTLKLSTDIQETAEALNITFAGKYNYFTFDSVTGFILDGTNSGMALYPATTEFIDLGKSDSRWKAGYFRDVDARHAYIPTNYIYYANTTNYVRLTADLNNYYFTRCSNGVINIATNSLVP